VWTQIAQEHLDITEDSIELVLIDSRCYLLLPVDILIVLINDLNVGFLLGNANMC
jgi:hypothetical protein